MTAVSILQALPALEQNRAELRAGAFPADTTAIMTRLIADFARDSIPIEVSFRDLVPWMKVGERATHYLHSYPAKLLPQIAHFFLAAKGWHGGEVEVLDPFAGTGTVALEASLAGQRAIYVDANPLARLITEAKTQPTDVDLAASTMEAIARRVATAPEPAIPWVVNIDHWYTPQAKADLGRIRAALLAEPLGVHEAFFWATFSAAARKASRANPRFAVPVRAKVGSEQAERDCWQIFQDQFNANIRRHKELSSLRGALPTVQCGGTDARDLRDPINLALPMADCSIDLVITSPPYASAQKYIRASSLSLGWLGLTGPKTLKSLENKSIGREHFLKSEISALPPTGLQEADELISTISLHNVTRAAICANYLIEMDDAFSQIVRVLRPGGKVVIVIGDNTVCGFNFPSSRFLASLLCKKGLDLKLHLTDRIKSRGLLTKRSGGAAAIATETILVFEK